jgi:cytochrome c oxidase subunit 4
VTDRVERREPAEPSSSSLTLVLVGVALLVLTLTTIELAKIDLGGWNTPVALLIAAVKAALVVVFFMHGRFAPPLTRLVMFAGLVWLGIILVGTTDEVVTRFWNGVPGH